MINRRLPREVNQGDVLGARLLSEAARAVKDIMLADGPGARGPGPKVVEGLEIVFLEFVSFDTLQDYYNAKLFGSSGANVKVVKPYILRPSVTSHGGVSFSYSTDAARTAGGTESQVLIPALDAGDPIYAARLPTGVFISGVDVGLLDLNIDARGWAALP